MEKSKIIEPKTVCYFGTFPKNQAYSRNLIIEKCLRLAGWEVIECRVETKMTAAKRVHSFTNIITLVGSLFLILGNWFNLFLEHRKIKNYDLMIVGYPSHIDVFLGFLLSKIRRRPLVIDAFIGLYDTVVKDRKLINEANPLSRLLWLFEYAALHLADKIMVDTQAHKQMIVTAFGLKSNRVFAIPVGIDEDIWIPQPLPSEKNYFNVAVWSTFIPLHGMQIIVEAADVLASQNSTIKFQVMGEGQTADQFAQLVYEKKLNNIEWRRGFFDIHEIVNMAVNSHCCLGIFGTTEKTNRVVPYKVYQALSLGRPVITSDTPEMRRIFDGTPGGVLIPSGDGNQLAKAILRLSQDRPACQRLSENAKIIYNRWLSNSLIQQKLDLKLKQLTVNTQC